MRISIGILAWNEESAIVAAIRSVFAQTLLTGSAPDGEHVEVVCLPNGCTDNTAELAAQALREGERRCAHPRLKTKLHEIERPSRRNAYNVFVHEVSDPQAEYLVLMDGDVLLYHPDTLRDLVRTLEHNPEAHMAGARNIKHISLRRTWNPLHLISLGISKIRRAARPTGFGGCLYCAPASILRRFMLPDIHLCEDAFKRAIIRTDFFTHPGKRIVVAPKASVLFECYTTPRAVFKSLKRRAAGIAINTMVYDELWAKATPQEDGGQLLLRWRREDPQWAQKLMERKIQERGRWVMPRGMVTKWLRLLRKLPLPKALAFAPLAVVATLIQGCACIAANRAIRSGRLEGMWFETPTWSS